MLALFYGRGRQGTVHTLQQHIISDKDPQFYEGMPRKMK
jgi:hypothetical protein